MGAVLARRIVDLMFHLQRIDRAEKPGRVPRIQSANLHDHLQSDILQGAFKRIRGLRPVLMRQPEKEAVFTGLREQAGELLLALGDELGELIQ